jgi:hypothetical protein
LAKDTICFFWCHFSEIASFFRIVIGHPLFLDKHWCKQKSFDNLGSKLWLIVVMYPISISTYTSVYPCGMYFVCWWYHVISPISVRWNGNDMCPRTFHQCYQDGVYLNVVPQIPFNYQFLIIFPM